MSVKNVRTRFASREEETAYLTAFLRELQEMGFYVTPGQIVKRWFDATGGNHDEATEAQVSREVRSQPGLMAVLDERARQLMKYTPEDDDRWQAGQLAIAAGCLAMASVGPKNLDWAKKTYPRPWEFPDLPNVPHLTPAELRLGMAGALAAAEIERRLRARGRL